MSALLTKIGQLAVFLICAQTLVHFRPKGSYEKYIKLLVSMMLLILFRAGVKIYAGILLLAKMSFHHLISVLYHLFATTFMFCALITQLLK